ncbi:alpha/beta-hydrolase [Auriculariales sp. MPI-PUGE-AT-0066]|nr:alpha/beta-hydrolase [Auriculariales sp. MPI-PUGE-AT-0066]
MISVNTLVLTAALFVSAASASTELERIHAAKGFQPALGFRPVKSTSSFKGAANVASKPKVFAAPVAADKDAFHVDGSKIPLLDATVQDSYAGQIALSGDAAEKRKLFFWYWPSSAQGGSDTLTIWLNGGPGCSSMTGALSELGPFTYAPGTDKPTLNEHAWSTVTDMLFVDQPLGTGFSNGTSDVTNENDVADRFYGFLANFYATFPELLQKKLYIAGESYAGYYIPYITKRILDATAEEKKATPIDIQSILINDGVFSDFLLSEYAPTYVWASSRKADLGITNEQLDEIKAASDDCGFTSLMKQVTYPPQGPLIWDDSNANSRSCMTFDTIFEAASSKNKCFSIYDITLKCPTAKDPIAEYFSRKDVQEVLHVPNFGEFAQCNDGIFPEGIDDSPYTDTIIPGLISSLPRGVTLWHGLDDMIVLAEGTRLTIQNMTWGATGSEKQGFQSAPTEDLILDGKKYGTQHTERGLTYYEVLDAGHMIPADQPILALEVLRTVLGKGGALVTGNVDGTSTGSNGSNGTTAGQQSSVNGSGSGVEGAASNVGVSIAMLLGAVALAITAL